MAALGVAALTVRAHACSWVVYDVTNGVLSTLRDDISPVPRNVAFVQSNADPKAPLPKASIAVAGNLSNRLTIWGHAFKSIRGRPGTFIAKMDEPLDANVEIGSEGMEFTTGDFLDETPPETPNATPRYPTEPDHPSPPPRR